MKKFFVNVGDGGFNAIVEEFSSYDWSEKTPTKKVPPGFPTEDEILLAVMHEDMYEGSAVVIFERDGKLYEQESSHCSCNSHSDCEWEHVKPITEDYLKMRGLPSSIKYGVEEAKDTYDWIANGRPTQ